MSEPLQHAKKAKIANKARKRPSRSSNKFNAGPSIAPLSRRSSAPIVSIRDYKSQESIQSPANSSSLPPHPPHAVPPPQQKVRPHPPPRNQERRTSAPLPSTKIQPTPPPKKRIIDNELLHSPAETSPSILSVPNYHIALDSPNSGKEFEHLDFTQAAHENNSLSSVRQDQGGHKDFLEDNRTRLAYELNEVIDKDDDDEDGDDFRFKYEPQMKESTMRQKTMRLDGSQVDNLLKILDLQTTPKAGILHVTVHRAGGLLPIKYKRKSILSKNSNENVNSSNNNNGNKDNKDDKQNDEKGKRKGRRQSNITAWSDPYVSLRLGSHRKRTEVLKKTLEPEWNSTMKFKVKQPDKLVLQIVVKHFQSMGKSPVLGDVAFLVSDLARVCIQGKGNREMGTKLNKVYPLQGDDSSCVCGEIEVSFSYTEKK